MVKGKEHCPNCSYLSENRATEDLITRASARIRMESLKYEGDLLNPQRYDKASKKVVPNEEFLKRNGTRAKSFFDESMLSREGYGKLGIAIKKEKETIRNEVNQFKSDVIHEGNKAERIKELIK